MNVYVPIHHELLAGRSLDDDALLDSRGVLKVRLKDGKGAVVYVSFDDYFVYRKRDEGDSYRTLQELDRVATFKIGIYRVEESEFLHWFGEESAHVKDGMKLKHFSLATLNSIIDVISLGEPEIRADVGTDQKA
jgi:hypothetical protein